MTGQGNGRDAAAAGSHAGSADPADGITVDVRRGMPTEEELAALIAVVSEAYLGEAAEAVADDRPRRSGWELSQRALRQPLRRDLGWGRFG